VWTGGGGNFPVFALTAGDTDALGRIYDIYNTTTLAMMEF